MVVLALLVHLQPVTHHRRLLCKLTQADVAPERPLSRVRAHVVDQVNAFGKRFCTDGAAETSLIIVLRKVWR